MKILLPTDGSEYADDAADFLHKLELSPRDEITILHVIPEEPFQEQDPYYTRKIREVREAIAATILDHTRTILANVPAAVAALMVKGQPDECIVGAASERDVDLIVMGPRRTKGIHSRIVGSITKSVSIHSPKPMLVIKPFRKKLGDTLRILFATDGSHHARRAGEILSSIPFPATTEVIILNVIPPAFYDIPEQYVTTLDDEIRENIKSVSEKALPLSNEVISNVGQQLRVRFSKIESMVKVGEPSDEILQTAYERDADIIALGSKGMGGFRGVIGSISRYILSVAECSVLIGKG